jgi:exopolyphosphatase/pppGpp-phosphohydrolase
LVQVIKSGSESLVKTARANPFATTALVGAAILGIYGVAKYLRADGAQELSAKRDAEQMFEAGLEGWAEAFDFPAVEKGMAEANVQITKQSSEIAQQALQNINRRAAIDAGSGAVKVCIAEVNVDTNQIEKILFEKSFPLPLQKALEQSPNQSFDGTIQEKSGETFREVRQILDTHEVQTVTAIATESYRKASNGKELSQAIHHFTGIPLRIISQEEEGVIAFNSAIAASKADPNTAAVWDIGTGSHQITMQNGDGQYQVFKSAPGSVPFQKQMIQSQGKDPTVIKSLNPINETDRENARKMTASIVSEMESHFRDTLPTRQVLGIGRLFNNSIKPLATQTGSIIKQRDLNQTIDSFIGKNDQALNNPFAAGDVSNCLLVEGMMHSLNIPQVTTVDTTTAQGLLIGKKNTFSRL